MLREKIYQQENPSEWIRDACYQRLERESDPKFIDQQIAEKTQELQYWKDLKKQPAQNKEKIREILNRWYDFFTMNDRFIIEDHFNRKWMRENILPELKKAGCKTYTEGELLQLFLDHHEPKYHRLRY